MGCGDEKLSKYLTQTFTAHCNAMICPQVTLSGDAEWPKVADAVIEARISLRCLMLHTFGKNHNVLILSIGAVDNAPLSARILASLKMQCHPGWPVRQWRGVRE